MRRSKLLAAACAVAGVLVASCGGTPTPRSALTRQFGQISEVYPFHADLSGSSRLYVLAPTPASGSSPALSPIAAVVVRYKENWSVWNYASIPVATGPSACQDAAFATVTLTVSPRDVEPPKPPKPHLDQVFQPKRVLIVGELDQNSGPVGSMVFSLGGRSYAAHLLPDGFWFVDVRNTGGQVGVTLKNGRGRVICRSGNSE